MALGPEYFTRGDGGYLEAFREESGLRAFAASGWTKQQ